MMKVKEKWVGVYTSRIMHFNSTTTQCVEGTHSAIKHALESSRSLTRLFSSLDRWLCLHHEENFLQNKSESIGIDPLLQKSTLLEKLDEILAVSAIDLSEIKMPKKIVGKGHSPGTKLLPIAVKLIDQLKKKLKLLKKSIVEVQMICKIFLVESDGNCGFCSLAVAIRENEKNWILVKLAMRGQLTKRMEIYRNWLGYLAANTFSVPITIFDELNEQSMLFFPLDTPLRHRKNLIILHLINGNHIVYIDMKNYMR
ncbi:12919_t:CDS:2, partial [Gigaspora margarita]